MNRIAGILIVAAALFSGCAKPPMIAIDEARASVEVAKAADAEKYAPAEFAKAEQKLTALDGELKGQSEKFALFRSYTRAKEFAIATKEFAEGAAASAKAAARSGGALQGIGENPFERTLNALRQGEQKLSCTCTCTPQT